MVKQQKIKNEDLLSLTMAIVENSANVARTTLNHEPSQNELRVIQKAMLEGANVALAFKKNGAVFTPRRGRGRPPGSKNKPKEN